MTMSLFVLFGNIYQKYSSTVQLYAAPFLYHRKTYKASTEFNGETPQPPSSETVQQPTEGTSAECAEPQKDNGVTEEPQGTSESGEAPADEGFEMSQGGMGGRGGFDGRMQQGQNTPGTESTPMTFADFLKEYQTPIISVVLLALAFVFVIFYKKKSY